MASPVYFEFSQKKDHVVSTASDTCAQGYAVVHPIDHTKRDARLLVISNDGHIHLHSNPEFVLDVSGEAAKEGTRVVLYKKKNPPAKNQLWENRDGVIHSKLADGSFTLDVNGEGHVIISKNHHRVNFVNAEDADKGIQILVANYGGKDVTATAKQQHKVNKHFTASNAHFGDPLPNVPKFLHVIYSYNGITESVSIPEGGHFEPKPPKFEVLGATYGSADVTAKVKSLVPAGSDHVSFQVENSHFGDPNPNVFKNFTVAYVKNGELKVLALKEHDTANLH